MTTCIETSSCPPTSLPSVFGLYDTMYGDGFTVLAMALVVGIVTIAVYVRNRSLPMLTILGLYEVATFSSILTSKYISAQYHIAEYVMIFGGVTAAIAMILKLVKE